MIDNRMIDVGDLEIRILSIIYSSNIYLSYCYFRNLKYSSTELYSKIAC